MNMFGRSFLVSFIHQTSPFSSRVSFLIIPDLKDSWNMLCMLRVLELGTRTNQMLFVGDRHGDYEKEQVVHHKYLGQLFPLDRFIFRSALQKSFASKNQAV